jgi:hypothetical protein
MMATSSIAEDRIMAKSEDPFIVELWDHLVGAKLGPGGNAEAWSETPVRTRNRFAKAVRRAMQSPAAFRIAPAPGKGAR